jgi:hypothetical protein
MSNYTKATNFSTKDTLPQGDANKIVKGTEIDNEFNSIAGAISSKADVSSPAFTGVPTAPTATTGSNTTQIATTSFVKTAVDNGLTAAGLGTMAQQNKTSVDITGGTIVGITDLAVADGGTGVSTLTANAVVLGNGTSAVQTVAPSTSGNLLTSNGTTWVSSSQKVLNGGQVFTSSGTFTIPANVTSVKVTVVGGGGGGRPATNNGVNFINGQGGGGGAVAIKYVSGLTSGTGVSVTVGAGGGSNATGGTSSFGTHCSATGGSASGGTATGGDVKLSGGTGGVAGYDSTSGVSVSGSGAGSGAVGQAAVAIVGSGIAIGAVGQVGFIGGQGANGVAGGVANGLNATGYGNGGSGGTASSPSSAVGSGGSGSAGIVIVEW